MDLETDSIGKTVEQTYEEKIIAKIDIMRKLGDLRAVGAEISRNFTIESDLKSMKYEYNICLEKYEKEIEIKKRQQFEYMWHLGSFYCKFMLNNFNPFDIEIPKREQQESV